MLEKKHLNYVGRTWIRAKKTIFTGEVNEVQGIILVLKYVIQIRGPVNLVHYYGICNCKAN